MQQILVLSVFLLLIAFAYLYTGDQKLAIEIISIALFAALGAISGCLDIASHHLSRRPLFRVWRQPILIYIWPACGLVLAGGGGFIRRALELVARAVFSVFGVQLLSCGGPLRVFWPHDYKGWIGFAAGVALGAIVSVIFTFTTAGSVLTLQRRIQRLFDGLDALVSGFFAAYGIEAAMNFASALPIQMPAGAWAPVCFALLTMGLTLPSGAIMATGGGLLRNLTVDISLLRLASIPGTLHEWVAQRGLRVYGAIACFGFIFYELLDRTPLKFGSCISVDARHMYATMIYCALVGWVALWWLPPVSPPPPGP